MTFAVHPAERLHFRDVRLAVEVLDPVSGERIRDGVRVQARGMLREPIVNPSGLFVWTREAGRDPLDVSVDPGTLPFEARTAPVPALPNQFVSVSLVPRMGYPFATGVPGIRGRLVENRNAVPLQPVADLPVWLQWIDDSSGVATWVDAPVRARTDARGEFAVFVRLRADQAPVADPQGRLRMRVAALRAGAVRSSPEQTLAPGKVVAPAAPFSWNEFQP